MNEKKILVVDDDRDFTYVMSEHLEAHGYNVVRAEDAVLAVMVAQKERPNLIILDINMPAGDGFTVMERLAKCDLTSQIPIILVTGKLLSGRQRAIAEGAVAFFTKPVDFDQLLTLIGNLSDRPVGADLSY
jgi:CheY-like chemotaxis protein